MKAVITKANNWITEGVLEGGFLPKMSLAQSNRFEKLLSYPRNRPSAFSDEPMALYSNPWGFLWQLKCCLSSSHSRLRMIQYIFTASSSS